EHVRTARRLHPELRIVNGYGPSECTVFCSAHEVDALADSAVSIPIGKPVGYRRVYVLDHALNPVPVGVPGELYVGGPAVARGYLGRAAMTAEKFVPDPFEGVVGARLYRSGDRVRWLADGTLEFVGRVDGQVKIRGFRIEPGEVEAVLRQHPCVRECVVVAREDRPGDRRLVAYVVANPDAMLDGADLRTHLGGRLPEYMHPAAIVVLDGIPLTSRGKVDRRALPAPEFGGMAEYVAPATETEALLAGIWAELLEIEKVGIHDDFFALGGHSLLATRVAMRVSEERLIDLPVKAIFEAPTVARLAEVVDRLEAETLMAHAADLDALSDEEVAQLLAGESSLA
ncbi:MAG TPA: non-ribosomal peptide synthetase, partial [Armatimonadota bacterium]|nr:non-ribosomal peptide synthetase [Armatimonadota bacterium]